jgi:hypothetical protein
MSRDDDVNYSNLDVGDFYLVFLSNFSSILIPTQLAHSLVQIWMMEIVVLLLCIEEMNVRPSAGKGSSEPEIVQTVVEGHGEGDVGAAMSQKSEQLTAVAFMSNILKLLQQCMPVNNGLDFEANSDSTSDSNGAAAAGALGILRFPGRAAKKAWRQKAEHLQCFIDEWEWRLAVLQHLSPLSPQQPWQWGEALAVLHAAPSTLLNM